MLDPIFIRRKIKLIQEDLKHLEQFQDLTFDEVARDWIRWNALEWALAKIIGRAIDINRHLIAETGGKEITPPKDYTETFLLLKQLNILPEEFVSRIARSAGFRNRIIHEYNDIKKDLVYNTVGEAIEQYTQYCAYILQFLESFEKNTRRFSSGFGATGVIVAIFAFLVLLGGGYWAYQKYASPAPSIATETNPQTGEIDTSNWKTYRNEQYGFEVRYPSYGLTRDFSEQSTDDGFLVRFGVDDSTYNPSDLPDKPDFYIFVSQGTIMTAISYLTDRKDKSDVRQQNIRVGDTDFTLLEWTQPDCPPCSPGRFTAFLMIKGDRVYEIAPGYSFGEPGTDESESLRTETLSALQLILSTFKFIK